MDAKKDILFIMNDLHSGGAQKALISLLQVMDYSRFNIDLLLFKKEGVFLDKIPAEVTVFPVPEGYSYFDMPILSAISGTLKKGRFATLIHRILAVFVLKTEKNPAVREQKIWQYLSPGLKKMTKRYDVAVGFLEKMPNYFCIDKTIADKKLLWVHTNYSNMGMEPKYDNKYFEKADFIVIISQECAQDLQERFPQFSNKIKTIQNIISPDVVRKLANEAIDEEFESNNSIVTVGRMSHEKGIDLAIEACKILKEKGIDFHWYFIGDGTQRTDLEDKLIAYQLREHVVFLGEKSNPYPYVKQATVYAQTSRFEGKSIAIDEARILQKPILATNFTTVNTQLTHLENGYIAAMNPQAIADGLINLFSDVALQQKFRTNLGNELLGTESEIEHFYELIH